jgi:diketogulonate reductase-like aldo/keto reductase
MEKIKESGKARSIGVSNYLESHIETTLITAKIPPAVNQIEFHLYLQHGSLLSYLESKGIAAAAYGPLTPVTKAKPGPCDEQLAILAKKYYVSEGDICLRWCIDSGVVAITTSSKEQRLSDYLRAMTFSMTPKEVKTLSEAGEKKHYRGFWEGKFDANDRS